MQLVGLDGTTVRTQNADTRMYGWDVEARASPIEELELSAVVSFLKAEVLDYKTLDPAALEFFPGDPGPAARSGWVALYNGRRLVQREAAEDLTEGGSPITYADRFCYPSPASVNRPSRSRPTHRCNTVTPFGGLDDFSGDQLSRSPKWKYTFSGGYEISIGRFGTLTPRAAAPRSAGARKSSCRTSKTRRRSRTSSSARAASVRRPSPGGGLRAFSDS